MLAAVPQLMLLRAHDGALLDASLLFFLSFPSGMLVAVGASSGVIVLVRGDAVMQRGSTERPSTTTEAATRPEGGGLRSDAAG